MARWGRIDEVWTWGRCSHNYTHASQRYLQTAYDFRRCSWCCDKIFEDRECFLLQMKCMLSAIVEIIPYLAWLIISVWEKWAKIEGNDSKPLCVKTLLVDWGVCVQWARYVSNAIRQNRMGFSYIFSWSYHVWLLTPPFFLNVSTSSV